MRSKNKMKYIIEVYTRDKHELGLTLPFILDKKLAKEICKILNNSWPNLECIPVVKE
jgi:hypothetical protein